MVQETAFTQSITIMLILNTAKNARSGDYEVSLTFTYGNEKKLLQDHKAVSLHIKSYWEKHRSKVYVASLIIALLALVISAVWYFTHW